MKQKLKRLWWEILDWMRPRYVVGIDLAAGEDSAVEVICQRKRNGVLVIKSMRPVAYKPPLGKLK